MSLVAYGSSGESSDNEEETSESVNNVKNLIQTTRTILSLPAPKDADDTTSNRQSRIENNKINITKHSSSVTDEPILFKNLPKPKHNEISSIDEVEAEDDVIPSQKDIKLSQEKSLRKNRAPVKISLPSLSEFKDVEEEQEQKKRNRLKPSEKGTGLFSILPPPKGSSNKATIQSLIPDVVKKVIQPFRPMAPRQIKNVTAKSISTINKTTLLASINYDSDSEDESRNIGDVEQKIEGKMDFFSLANSGKISSSIDNSRKELFSVLEEPQRVSAKSNESHYAMKLHEDKTCENVFQTSEIRDQREDVEIFDKTLTSNVMNLPKEEIRMKNKAEVGPKLPVPEQEYNVDSQGNVAFDEKAIEYLCGKRGVKRKNKDFDEANIIEINAEDIKPDEREWLIKALTEEPAERPVSMESAGPSTQSRKKHQITYLAHQAKAMEVELKNQWAQNRVTRKQTQSKYGF